ncbi:MAG: SGNH/GDSL hydrolase family protein [Planctomycetes bacterium]|nr:SGNH/GDSL hydrolase family protein [Planctomycetota bacterium]
MIAKTWTAKSLWRDLALVCTLLVCRPIVAAEATAESLRLTLPPAVYAVVGQPMSIYFDNVVLTEKPETFEFRVDARLGANESNRWIVTPAAAQVGKQTITLSVSQSGRTLATATTSLRVVPADAGTGRAINLLIVGDSLTHATHYPNEIARLLSQPGNPQWTMLGTHKPANATAGVAHEGYGGWTWQRFATFLKPATDTNDKVRSSPFVFAVDGKAQLDVPRYVRDSCAGKQPDFITVLLGINDCFGAKPDDPANIDAKIDSMFASAKELLASLREAAPKAKIGLCLTTPPNARESGFDANYKGKYHRWGWKRIQHRVVERQLTEFAGREREGLYIVPTELNLDPVAGYPVDNGVHPNVAGYQQIGGTIYAWLKAELAE